MKCTYLVEKIGFIVVGLIQIVEELILVQCNIFIGHHFNVFCASTKQFNVLKTTTTYLLSDAYQKINF